MELHPDDLARIRRELLRILDRLDGRLNPLRGPVARVFLLVKSNRVPRYIGAFMKMILEARNAAEYEALQLSVAESEAVRHAWTAVRDWIARVDPKIAA